MDWFKTKETTEETPALADDTLLPLVRTMEDDLAGREVPTKVVPKAEPLAGFDPNAATGAAFYAAPGVVTSESVGTVPETSPFFQAAEEEAIAPSVSGSEAVSIAKPAATDHSTEETVASPITVTNTQTAEPPKGLPVISDEPKQQPSEPEQESKPVMLNVAPHPVGTSFEGVLPTREETMGQLKGAFSGEKRKWLFLALAGIILIAIGGGVYFWKMKQDKGPIPGEMSNSPLAPTMNKPVQPEPASQKQYQADQPNILSFDTETVTPAEIKAALLQAGQGIKKDGLTGAVEFIVRDQKLNPLALSRFAYLAKIELPTNLLEILDESFSIYIFIDQDRPRAVLLAYAKDAEKLSMELQKNEKALPGAMEPLFLDMTTAPKNNLTFRDGSYLERPVRFTNVDTALGLSVDYAVRGKQWIIGTSKNSLRAVLDKTGL